jgi:polyisoprenoid-binding protein YceI
MKKIMLGLALLPLLAAAAAADTYKLDESHSAVTFRIAHMAGLAKVNGRFDKFTATAEFTAGKPELWSAQAVIDAASVNTNSPDRDKHLRSADFFNVEKFPEITFKSVKTAGVKGLKGKLHGELTMLGVTKPVVLEVEGSGPVKDPWGNQRLGAVAKTTLNRKDFGMVWNKVLDAGGVMVGEKVEVTLELQFVKQ